jgi:hypothetical protein
MGGRLMPQVKSWKELPEHRKRRVVGCAVLGLFAPFVLCCGTCWLGSLAHWLTR